MAGIHDYSPPPPQCLISGPPTSIAFQTPHSFRTHQTQRLPVRESQHPQGLPFFSKPSRKFVTLQSISVYTQRAHRVRTVCAQCVHMVCAARTQYARSVHSVRTAFAQYAHGVHRVCTQDIHSVHTRCTQGAHSARTVCAQCAHSVHIERTACALCVHSVCTV